jgi:CheY-like chemotaxis protein
MTDGGTIKIKTQNFRLSDNTDVPLDNGDYIKITIVDEGNGISKEDQSKIFDPFFTTKPDGSGLGLTVCYSIVKNHNGHISVDSEVNKGTTFSIYLPAVHDKALKEINGDVQQKIQSGHVLIMDDDTDVQGALGAMLKEIGFDVVTSKNGEEALQTYKKYFDNNEKFKFIIMDLTVPAGLGGIEVLKEITKFDPDVKAIVSTGYSEILANDENKRHGFQAILAKPYTIKELSRAIDTLF